MKKGSSMTKPTKPQLVSALKRILNSTSKHGRIIALGHARNLIEKAAIVLLALGLCAAPALADYGSGCPVSAFAGMKAFEDAQGQQIPHQGQWFTASYTQGTCGSDESNALWSATPAPAVSDTCLGAADYLATEAAGLKRCARASGKVFWLPPGTYDVTACAPPVVEGVCAGSWTIEGYVVD
jgi:hypothetical protein